MTDKQIKRLLLDLAAAGAPNPGHPDDFNPWLTTSAGKPFRARVKHFLSWLASPAGVEFRERTRRDFEVECAVCGVQGGLMVSEGGQIKHFACCEMVEPETARTFPFVEMTDAIFRLEMIRLDLDQAIDNGDFGAIELCSRNLAALQDDMERVVTDEGGES